MAQQAILNFSDLSTSAVSSINGQDLPSGTKMVFYQATAPTGWTKDLVQHDKAIRVVTGGSGGSAGGSTVFSTAWAAATTGATAPGTDSQSQGGTVNSTALNHTHVFSHSHSTGGNPTSDGGGPGSLYRFFGNGTSDALPGNVTSATDLTHGHSFSPSGHSHTVNSHTHTTSAFTPAFVDVIIATKT